MNESFAVAHGIGTAIGWTHDQQQRRRAHLGKGIVARRVVAQILDANDVAVQNAVRGLAEVVGALLAAALALGVVAVVVVALERRLDRRNRRFVVANRNITNANKIGEKEGEQCRIKK